MLDLDIFDNGNCSYGRSVTIHISDENGKRLYTGGKSFYGYSWREIVKMIKEIARNKTGRARFHTTEYTDRRMK